MQHGALSLCSLLAATSQFSVLIDQRMQLAGCHNGNERRNAIWPTVHSLYVDNIAEPEAGVTMLNNILDNYEQSFPTTLLHPSYFYLNPASILAVLRHIIQLARCGYRLRVTAQTPVLLTQYKLTLCSRFTRFSLYSLLPSIMPESGFENQSLKSL